MTLCDLCHEAGPDPQVEIDGDLYCASCAEKMLATIYDDENAD